MTTVYDVIIVGCGPAGIAAAIDFQRTSNVNYVILEARDRIGGRAVTDTSTFGAHIPVDLGAQWIHHYRPENPLYDYEQADDKHERNYRFIFSTNTTSIFDIDGQPFTNESIEQAERIVDELCQDIRTLSHQATDRSMFDMIETTLIKYGTTHPKMKRLIELYFSFIEQYEAANLDQLSAKSYLKSDDNMMENNLALPDGFGTFVKAMTGRYKLPIELNSIVTCVDASNSDGIVRLTTADRRTLLCKYVLVTVPLGCLKKSTIEFLPCLPTWKQDAIDRMGFGLSNKIFLQFPRIFWNRQWSMFFTASTRYRTILCHADVGMLLVMVCARVAYELEDMSDADVVDDIMLMLRTIFSNEDVPQPQRYLITRWNSDRFACGSYASFSVGTNNQTLIDLARDCHERIYWAGEHTNYDGTIGCVDSAFESGQREAKRLVERLHSNS
jgi:monoamine oxidase